MSIVLKNINLDIHEEVDDDNLVPVSDEELEEIIEALGKELVAEIEAEYESSELLPEEEEILATDDMDEKVRLYNKYYNKLFPEN